MFDFSLQGVAGASRAGAFTTPHGTVQTPAFMPVGTAGTVKGVSPDELVGLGACMILANTYHLYLRPGHERVRALGGVHGFMRWDRPILTDSGGYQVFSLAATSDVHDEGVVFRSHIDGSRHVFTPERVIDIERELGADVIMALDQCPPGGVTRGEAHQANRRTLLWLARCQTRFAELGREGTWPVQSLFPVLQGNVFDDLRREHVSQFLDLGDWDGWGIGGLSVGEQKPDTWRILEVLHAEIPESAPRYLMGVGYPDDLLEAISRGCAMFDCVAPTRNARHGTAWTSDEGQVNLKAARFKDDVAPIDPACDCYCCARFDRAYLRHLLVAGELLGPRLVSLHNLRFLVRLAELARAHILSGDFGSWSRSWLERYHSRGV